MGHFAENVTVVYIEPL